jgi:hypothetical protein
MFPMNEVNTSCLFSATSLPDLRRHVLLVVRQTGFFETLFVRRTDWRAAPPTLWRDRERDDSAPASPTMACAENPAPGSRARYFLFEVLRALCRHGLFKSIPIAGRRD